MNRLTVHLKPIKSLTHSCLLAVIGLSLVLAPVLTTPVQAATLPQTVSADPLPTVQINGIVWAQVTIGNTVYATGRFTQARPAGVAVGGAGSVTRSNLLAYDITTGNLNTSFVHSLTGTGTVEGRAIAASPDGKRLYVGGKFSTVDGAAHANFAAFDLTTNKVLSGFSGTNSSGTVTAIAATNTRVYIGGDFTTAGGQTRTRAAAYESNGALATNWAPSITSTYNIYTKVTAMVVTPVQGNLIIGGSFNRVNGQQYLSNAAVKLDTGAPVTPWASTSSSFPIRDQVVSNGVSAGSQISSLSTDGSQVFLTSWGFGSASLDGFFEGRASLNPTNGNINWINDCHGDSYSAFPVNGVLYSANHSHDCSMMGLWGERASFRALAETTSGTTGTNTAPTDPKYSSFAGYNHTNQLAWYPTLNTANVSGSTQAAWSVTGNANYISLGGEFTLAENKPQQGLVRYAVHSLAPNQIGPSAYDGYINIAVGAKNAQNNPVITVTSNVSDRDDSELTYKVYRNGVTTPVYTGQHASYFWKPISFSFTDTSTTSAASGYNVVVRGSGSGPATSAKHAIDDGNQALKYTGTWTAQTGIDPTRHLIGNGLRYTATNGDKATISFNGSYFGLYTEKSSTRGTMTISIDGGTPVTVDAYVSGTARLPQQLIFEKTGLASGAHTAVITKTGGTNMVIDGFKIAN